MPKRPNPFSNCSPLQLKNHIGVREIDMNSEDNMKRVYDRTRQLLYEGANKELPLEAVKPEMNYGNCNCEKVTNNLHCSGVRSCEQKPLPQQFQSLGVVSHGNVTAPAPVTCSSDVMEVEMWPQSIDILPGQMQLDSSCHLTGVFKQPDSQSQGVSTVSVCHVCRQSVKATSTRCYFCDKTICLNCSHQCFGCSHHFCHFCSVINYDASFERSFCLNCVS